MKMFDVKNKKLLKKYMHKLKGSSSTKREGSQIYDVKMSKKDRQKNI